MALNIKNPHVEALVDEIATMTGESKTEAVRRALEERRGRLEMTHGGPAERRREAYRFLEREIWPKIPGDLLSRGLSREEQEEILGYGPEGV